MKFPAFLLIALSASAQPVEFNRDVRPIFSDRCYTCHGPDGGNRKAGLRLDVEGVARKALDKVIARVSSTNKSLRMPPAYLGHDALSSREIETLKRWVAEGASWQKHWAYIAPVRPASSSIDAFVQARLEREGLKLAPPASKETLLRRVTLDLTGLPPTPDEVATFLNDPSPNAWEKAVERLLRSPRYAERMAFRWMEAGRYADTNGYQSDGIRDMWRWRDWVIAAYQSNMPFDQFTIEQLAGDLLPNATLDQKIATAFHRNHRTTAEGGIVPEEFRVEYVADRVDTTATVWLGMTMGCARCHDHKYDPMTQRDFYRMFAYFNQVPEKGLVYNWGNDEPLIKAPTSEQQVQWDLKRQAVTAAESEWNSMETELGNAQTKWEKKRKKPSEWTPQRGLEFRDPLKERHFDGKEFVESKREKLRLDYLTPFTFAARIKPESNKGAILSKAQDYFEGSGHGLYLMDGKIRLHVVFRWTDIGMRLETKKPVALNRWQHVAVTYDGSRYAKGVHIYVDGIEREVDVLFDELNWPMDFKEPVRIGAGNEMRFTGWIDDARIYTRALTAQEARALAGDDRARRDLEFLETALPKKLKASRDNLAAVRSELVAFEKSLPTVMVMKDSETWRDTFVLNRGAYDAPGDKVSPGVPSFLPPLAADAPSNRLGLAKWLVSAENPLTARVTVNRYWQMLFGTGLVKTVEDFGSQGEWPMYLELLDWLAVEFRESGWDTKHVLKTIVMSDTYRQSSRMTSEAFQRDPENRLLTRGPRLRMPPEMIRDQALAASGLLVEKVGGPSVKPYQPPGLWQELSGGKGYTPDSGDGLYRRSLYTFWKRTVAPPNMVNFDSPNREACTVRESRTNTPLQALNLMNDVAFLEASRKLAERMMAGGGVAHGVRLVLGRDPKTAELAVLERAYEKFHAEYRADPKSAERFLKQGDSSRKASLDLAKLAAHTVVASLIFNLDEAVTKE